LTALVQPISQIPLRMMEIHEGDSHACAGKLPEQLLPGSQADQIVQQAREKDNARGRQQRMEQRGVLHIDSAREREAGDEEKRGGIRQHNRHAAHARHGLRVKLALLIWMIHQLQPNEEIAAKRCEQQTQQKSEDSRCSDNQNRVHGDTLLKVCSR
jgi:hypothetical protein